MEIGKLEIKYVDGTSDNIPLTIGATTWFAASWAQGYYAGIKSNITEPFKSSKAHKMALNNALKLHDHDKQIDNKSAHRLLYLAVKPRNKKIQSVIIHDDPSVRGKPLISAITLSCDSTAENLIHFRTCKVAQSDLKHKLNSAGPFNWEQDLE